MIRNFRWTEEAVWGTYASMGTSYRLPMDAPGNFKLMTTRPFWALRSGSGMNIPRKRGSSITAIGGQLTHRQYWDAPDIALWHNRIVGGTAPWTTDQRNTDLASATVDFDYSYDDLTFKYMRYTGCKPGQNVKLDCKNDPSNPFLMFTTDILGGHVIPNPEGTGTSLNATTFPPGDESNIPKNPVTFQECVITGLGGTLSHVDGFTVSINNLVKPYYDNASYPNRITMNGRTVTMSLHLHLQAATDPRYTFYESVAALGALHIVFTNPAATGQTLTIDFRSKLFADGLDEEMILDDDAYTTVSATAHLDSGTGDDFLISVTPP